jgi:hypothetical protein
MVNLVELGYCLALTFIGLGLLFYLLGKGFEKWKIKQLKNDEED